MVAVAHGAHSIINYSVFVGIIGMLSLFYLIPATIKESLAVSPIFVLIVDLINVLFWFCGAVALAAELGVHSCSNEVSRFSRRLKLLKSTLICLKSYRNQNGIIDDVNKPNRSNRCTEAQALCAFLFFGFFAFLVSAVFSGLNMGGGGGRPGIRRGPMSHV